MSSPARPTQYIIRLKDEVDMDRHIQSFQEALNKEDSTPFKVTHQWTPDFLNAYVGEFHPDVLNMLREHQDIKYICENSKLTPSGIIEQQTDACWGISRINRNAGFDSSAKATDLTFKYRYDDTEETGKGVDVYVVDSGIYIKHEDFGKRARWGTSVQKNTKENPVTDDDIDGHGTSVAGIVGGKRFGVAKGVSLVAVKVTNDAGDSSVQDSLDAFKWVLSQHKKSKSKLSVLNISRGTDSLNPAMNEIATKLVDAGIHVVASAGNANKNARYRSPASAPLVNTVGATDILDKKANFSNWGPCVDFFAPGEDITTCGIWKDENAEKKVKDPKSTRRVSGTSYAAPHVAGIIATFISLHGNMHPITMTHVLKLLAIKVNNVGLLARGALHVEANFKLVSKNGAMRILNCAIFSKIKASISKYDAEVSKFGTNMVEAGKGNYGTHEFPFMIVSAFDFLDLMLYHEIDGTTKDDKNGTVQVKSSNGKAFNVSVPSGWVEWEIFKYLPLFESTSTDV